MQLEMGNGLSDQTSILSSLPSSQSFHIVILGLDCAGKTNRVVGYQHGRFQDFDINEALEMDKGIDPYQYEIAQALSKH